MLNFYQNLEDKEDTVESKMTNLIQKRKEKNLPVYNMSLGVDQFAILPEIITEISKNLKDKNFYKPNGPKEVRNYLLTSFKEEYDYKPTEVLFGTGIKQLLFTFLQAFNGEVIFLTPCWSSYIEQCKLLKIPQGLPVLTIEEIEKEELMLTLNRKVFQFVGDREYYDYFVENVDKIKEKCIETHMSSIYFDPKLGIVKDLNSATLIHAAQIEDKLLSEMEDFGTGDWKLIGTFDQVFQDE